jgi:hypothetical protein
MKDMAISFARTAISLGSVCLALLSISIPSSPSLLLDLTLPIRVLLSFTGFVLFLSAALLLDWAIDTLSDKDWNEMNIKIMQLGDKELDAKHSFIARLKLFGGGYLLLSIGIGFVAFSMLFLLIIHSGLSNGPLLFLSISISAYCGVGIFIKMMTRKLGTVARTIFFIGGPALISILLNIYLLYT